MWLGIFSVIVSVGWYYQTVLGGVFNYHDDLLTITQVKSLDIWSVFNSTIIDSSYYRPVIQVIIKGADVLFDSSAVPIRLFQIVLHVFTLFLFFRLCQALNFKIQAIWIAMLLLCFSPFTYIGIAKYGIEVGTYMLGVFFLMAMLMIVKEKVTYWLVLLITLLALLTREQGLLIAFTFFLYFSFEKKFLKSFSLVLLVFGYLYLRMLIVGQVGTTGFSGSTGWFTDFLSVDELNDRFESNYHFVYLYNMAAHFVSLFIYLPVKGQFVVADSRTLLFVITSVVTTWVILMALFSRQKYQSTMKKQHILLLILVLLANILIAYSYVRYRMLFISGLSMSVLMAYGVHVLLIRSEVKKVMIIPVFSVLVLWIGVAIIQNAVLERKLDHALSYYKEHSLAPSGVNQQLYNDIREQLK
jgi:hypothetical protein